MEPSSTCLAFHLPYCTISHLLSQIPYESRDPDEVTIPPRPLADDYERPEKDRYKYVPDHAGAVAKR